MGGLVKRMRETVGTTTVVDAGKMFALLRVDADVIEQATTPEQIGGGKC